MSPFTFYFNSVDHLVRFCFLWTLESIDMTFFNLPQKKKNSLEFAGLEILAVPSPEIEFLSDDGECVKWRTKKGGE